VAVVGLGLTVFMVFMMLGRFTADAVINRFGEALVCRVGMLVSAPALLVALVLGSSWSYLVACAVLGLAVAPLFPAAMHAASRVRGMSAGMAVSTVTWLSRVGFVIAPVTVGLIAESVSVTVAMGVVVVAALALVPLARLLPGRRSG